MPSVAESFALALRYLQGGHADAAQQIYRQILQIEPNHADSHHLLGIIAFQKGQLDDAAVSIRQAIALNPRVADYHTNLGLTYRAQGRIDEAAACLHEALRLNPNHVEALNGLGTVLEREGKPAEAAVCYRQALQFRPTLAVAWNNLGIVLTQQDQCEEAIQSYHEALRLQPGYAEAYYNLGNTFSRRDEFDKAVESYQSALRLKPNLVEASNNLANVLSRQGKLSEAVHWYQEALRINPNSADAYSGLANCQERQSQFQDALVNYQRALELDPGLAEAHNGYGCVLQRMLMFDEAIACHENAVRLKPTFAEAYNNLAAALSGRGRVDDAQTAIEEALRLKPDYAKARMSRALFWLMRGEFDKGWPEYEWRWSLPGLARRNFSQPLWDGSDLEGRTILLYAEQGLGDALQFVRYVPLVKQRGGRVIVECQAAVMDLLTPMPGIDAAVAAGSPLPEFDVHLPLLSLPRIFGTTLATIPSSVPYLQAPADLVTHWQREIAKLRNQTDFDRQSGRQRIIKVGMAWQGNPENAADRIRSIPLLQFVPLSRVRGIELYSLQVGPGREQLPTLASAFAMFDLGSRFNAASCADAAAAIMSMDIVVTVDTAVAHLAGALGVPVWVPLPLAPDWRWLLQREDSPWYPTMRLFRQRQLGDWSEVMIRIADALRDKVRSAGK